mgnify:CR=1 FL=1
MKQLVLPKNFQVKEKKVASDFEKNVKNELSFLDMPKMQFFVNFDKGNLSSTGFDKIEFMISANPGEPPKSLSKVASGGELSRIMLAIKSIISYNDTIGTLIGTGEKVGIVATNGENHQSAKLDKASIQT